MSGSAGRIVTVTPNPSLDRTYELPAPAPLVRGGVNRAAGDRLDPGGKGVNVSRALTAAGHATRAVLPLGGPGGRLLGELLAEQGIEVRAVPVRGGTRINVGVAEPGGPLTKINAPGPELTPAESAALLAEVRDSARAGTGWLACCGSLPRGLPDDWYARAVAAVHGAGARIALDTSGPALAAALAAGPDVLKPNLDELAEAVGGELRTLGDAVDAAKELRKRGAVAVLASLGARGMLLVAEDGCWYGTAPVDPAEVRSDVGAGDASLAGFLGAGGAGGAAGGAAGPAALAAALAHGAAAVRLPGSAMPRPSDLRPQDVTVTPDLSPDLRLR